MSADEVKGPGIGVIADVVFDVADLERGALFWSQIAARAGDTGAEQELANLRTRLPMSESIDVIEKAIIGSNLGFNPSNNGESIIIHVPMLTEERRKGLVKAAHAEGEHAKVGIRSSRQKAMDAIKAAKKDGLPEDTAKGMEAEVEKLTGTYNKKVEGLIEAKEKDIMKV